MGQSFINHPVEFGGITVVATSPLLMGATKNAEVQRNIILPGRAPPFDQKSGSRVLFACESADVDARGLSCGHRESLGCYFVLLIQSRRFHAEEWAVAQYDLSNRRV